MNKFVKMLRWRFHLDPREERPFHMVPPYTPDHATPDLHAITHPDPSKIQITWVGHSTFLIQVAGHNILTDPIWSMRASPLSFMGPKRQAKPGVPFEYLPAIDTVVVSHTHYDHLDLPTIRRLGNTPHYITQKGISAWFKRKKITNVTDLSWWQTETVGNITIHATPAVHWSKRSLFREPFMGWGGFVIETPLGNMFFAADTAYSPTYFKEIGERLGPMRVSMIPIGAYSPRWFMSEFHIDPIEAVAIHQEVRSAHSIAMHWGTFALTDEPLGEPPLYLEKQMKEAGLDPASFTTAPLGATLVL